MLALLEARDFRNLEPFDWRPGRGIHLILGHNGAGKTSLLEAIYLLATTRSFRTHQIADCCRHGSGRFHVLGEVETERRVRLEMAYEDGRRQRAVNGKRTSLAEHLEVLPVIVWTTGEGEILAGPPSERRRFLDRGVVSLRPSALSTVSRYRKALDEKRQLLLQNGSDLEPWNRVLAVAAAELIRLRASYLEKLNDHLRVVLDECRLGLPEIRLRYLPSPSQGLDGSEAIYEKVARIEQRERQLQRPLLGPHRDELDISWQGRALRRVASAGERKALGIALAAAQGRAMAASGREPLYILDDVDTELDSVRLEALWLAFRQARQVFASSNRPKVWDGIGGVRRWQCDSGYLDAL